MQTDNICKGRPYLVLCCLEQLKWTFAKRMQCIAGIADCANLLCPVPGLSTLANAYQIDSFCTVFITKCGALYWQTHAGLDTISAQQPVVQHLCVLQAKS